MIITFAGHSDTAQRPSLMRRVEEILRYHAARQRELLCYCGGYGGFDDLCAKVCRKVKKDFPNVRVIFVAPYLSKSYQDQMNFYLSQGLYDEAIYPPLEDVLPRFAIVKRNEWMVRQADLVLAYVVVSFGGAAKTLEYARRKGKPVCNLAQEIV